MKKQLKLLALALATVTLTACSSPKDDLVKARENAASAKSVILTAESKAKVSWNDDSLKAIAREQLGDSATEDQVNQLVETLKQGGLIDLEDLNMRIHSQVDENGYIIYSIYKDSMNIEYDMGTHKYSDGKYYSFTKKHATPEIVKGEEVPATEYSTPLDEFNTMIKDLDFSKAEVKDKVYTLGKEEAEKAAKAMSSSDDDSASVTANSISFTLDGANFKSLTLSVSVPVADGELKLADIITDATYYFSNWNDATINLNFE